MSADYSMVATQRAKRTKAFVSTTGHNMYENKDFSALPLTHKKHTYQDVGSIYVGQPLRQQKINVILQKTGHYCDLVYFSGVIGCGSDYVPLTMQNIALIKGAGYMMMRNPRLFYGQQPITDDDVPPEYIYCHAKLLEDEGKFLPEAENQLDLPRSQVYARNLHQWSFHVVLRVEHFLDSLTQKLCAAVSNNPLRLEFSLPHYTEILKYAGDGVASGLAAIPFDNTDNSFSLNLAATGEAFVIRSLQVKSNWVNVDERVFEKEMANHLSEDGLSLLGVAFNTITSYIPAGLRGCAYHEIALTSLNSNCRTLIIGCRPEHTEYNTCYSNFNQSTGVHSDFFVQAAGAGVASATSGQYGRFDCDVFNNATVDAANSYITPATADIFHTYPYKTATVMDIADWSENTALAPTVYNFPTHIEITRGTQSVVDKISVNELMTEHVRRYYSARDFQPGKPALDWDRRHHQLVINFDEFPRAKDPVASGHQNLEQDVNVTLKLYFDFPSFGGTANTQQVSSQALGPPNYIAPGARTGATVAGRWRVDVIAVNPAVRHEYTQQVRFEKA